jgi:NAD(P)-dependent dehydrogenase (short-subunit alcohol dehydrogenase family)
MDNSQASRSSLSGRVAVVTGGGGGIGAATAVELAGRGATVVVLDPGVGVEGEPLDEPTAARTVDRIEAAGGQARASAVSVTDSDAIRMLFAEIVADLGSLDIVVNTAGILRFPQFFDAAEQDWRVVLDVHLHGYLNVLAAALPIMGAAGYGRIVGFTSGAGLARTSPDGPAYGCAKRAVASLTWKVGRVAPPGVTVNALSPIAGTRMVEAALIAAGSSPKGLDLSAMPQAEDMAPAAAMLCSDEIGWCSGQIVFCAGSELSLIGPPTLIEAVRSADVDDFATALETLVPVVLEPGEAGQRAGGGSNPRFGRILTPGPGPVEGGAGAGA